MANKKKHRPMHNSPINLTVQKLSLQNLYPESTCYVHKNVLIWKGDIKPGPFSKTYPVELNYKLNERPHVEVYGDNLQKLDSPSFPHHYNLDMKNKRVEMCLYYKRDFTAQMLLSETVIPWAAEWLYFYESWLITGEWSGGGIHLEKRKRRKYVPKLKMMRRQKNGP